MRWLAAIFGAFVLLTACSHRAPALPVETIVVDTDNGSHSFTVEIAATEAERAHGLMERTTLAPDAGMLFDYPSPRIVAFWMKDTPLPLDMLFIRADGTVSTIIANAMPYSETPIPAMEPVKAVLELNGGRAAELGIHPGNKVHAKIFSPRP